MINPSGGINWNKLRRIIFTQLPPENIKAATEQQFWLAIQNSDPIDNNPQIENKKVFHFIVTPIIAINCPRMFICIK